MRDKEWDNRKYHHGHHRIAHHAEAPVQVQIPMSASQHIEHHIEKKRSHTYPPQYHSKLKLPCQQLKHAHHHAQNKGSRQVCIFMQMRTYSDGIQNIKSLLHYQVGIYSQLFQQRGLLLKNTKSSPSMARHGRWEAIGYRRRRGGPKFEWYKL